MKTKKLISLILAVLMLVSASALFTLPSSAAVTGTCGPDLTWTLEGDTLTVSGTGMMYYYNYQGAPRVSWYDYADRIKIVYIGIGVTSIGLNAFEDCLNITDVYYEGSKHDWSLVSIYGGNETFLDAVLHYGIVNEDEYWDFAIEDGVLYLTGKGTMDTFRGIENKRPWVSQISKIKKVVVCDGLTSIGAAAFTGMSNLEEVVVGGTVYSIGMDAFSYCTKLTSITFNGKITEIGQGTVYSCPKLTKVTVTGQTKAQFLSVANAYLYNEQYGKATFTEQQTGSPVVYDPDGDTDTDTDTDVAVYSFENGMENWVYSPNNPDGMGSAPGVTQILFCPVEWDAQHYRAGMPVTVHMKAVDGSSDDTFTTTVATVYDGSAYDGFNWGICRVEPCLMDTPWIPVKDKHYIAAFTFTAPSGQTVTVTATDRTTGEPAEYFLDCEPAPVTPEPQVNYGDVNGDGEVNKKDSLALKKYLADNTYACELAAADVNGDGTVNKKDSLRLKQYLAGWEVALGPEVQSA